MTINKSIFGLRFLSHAEIYPSQEELRAFIESIKKNGGQEVHGNDLAKYRELLKEMQQDFQGKMFFGVLSHSRFVNPALKSAVEQYKYLLHELITLDFKKPKVFIRRWAALAEELSNIALYIRDNLLKIEKLCEASIVILVDLQIEKKFESQLIEEIKTHFKEHLKDSIHHGPIANQYLETVKKDVDMLSKEISVILREDVYALQNMYESIYDHTKKIAREIETLMDKYKSRKGKNFEDDWRLLEQVEQVLVSLISEYHFEFTATEILTETAHEDILLEKRKEMLDRLFELLHKERRSRSNRRTGEDRRRSNDQNHKGTERRSGKDRRTKKNRRISFNLSS
jgi:ferritin